MGSCVHHPLCGISESVGVVALSIISTGAVKVALECILLRVERFYVLA